MPPSQRELTVVSRDVVSSLTRTRAGPRSSTSTRHPLDGVTLTRRAVDPVQPTVSSPAWPRQVRRTTASSGALDRVGAGADDETRGLGVGVAVRVGRVAGAVRWGCGVLVADGRGVREGAGATTALLVVAGTGGVATTSLPALRITAHAAVEAAATTSSQASTRLAPRTLLTGSLSH